ncbi:MAG: exodeoxyribonuclease VII large subunit [Verrucomicrobiota bacterium]
MSLDDLDLTGGSALPPEPAADAPGAGPDSAWPVGELTREIRDLLEGRFGEVWVAGEISNLRVPGSGHLYFTLKDDEATLAAVMFKGQAARLGFRPEDGAAVLAKGEITVYEPRGQYQLKVSAMRPAGRGTLQERFEALKRKLEAEGLFDPETKRELPVFPLRVGIVTSLSGAAFQDFCQVLGRRAPGIQIVARGVRVQGEEAAGEIAAAVDAFGREAGTPRGVDVLVLARGGGSLEDLWAFNEEPVARALHACPLPTVAGVGHETDFSIADFVADVRAPTPSAAAEIVSRDWADWRGETAALRARLDRALRHELEGQRHRLARLSGSPLFREPRRVIERLAQRLDERRAGLATALRYAVRERRGNFELLRARWNATDPRRALAAKRRELRQVEARLRALSHESTLARGFAIVTDAQGKVLKRADAKLVGQEVRLRLAQGGATAEVKRVEE